LREYVRELQSDQKAEFLGALAEVYSRRIDLANARADQVYTDPRTILDRVERDLNAIARAASEAEKVAPRRGRGPDPRLPIVYGCVRDWIKDHAKEEKPQPSRRNALFTNRVRAALKDRGYKSPADLRGLIAQAIDVAEHDLCEIKKKSPVRTVRKLAHKSHN
jgi:hypothetical protein